MNVRALDSIRRLLRPLKTRIMLMIGRAVIVAVKDDGKLQTAQLSILSGEVKDAVERFQQYGFTAVPLPGCEAVVLFHGGNRDHGIIISADDRRFRKTGLQPGEVAMYSYNGDSIILKNGNIIETNTAQSKLSAIASAETETPYWKVDASGMAELLAGFYAKIEAPMVDIGKGALEPPLNGITFQTAFNLHTHTVFGIPTTPPVVPSTPDHLSTQVKLGK